MPVISLFERWSAGLSRGHLEWFVGATAVAAMVWGLLALFLTWRRSVTNLTPVDLPAVNPAASPDFLHVDHEKRKKALAAGDHYRASKMPAAGSLQPIQRAKSIFGWSTLFLAVVTLVVAMCQQLWPIPQ